MTPLRSVAIATTPAMVLSATAAPSCRSMSCGCCACAESGRAVTPVRRVMNSRRVMWLRLLVGWVEPLRNPSWAVQLARKMMGFAKSSTHPTAPAIRHRASIRPRLEISQIGRRLVLAGGHQVVVAAAVVGLLADLDQLLVARAVIFLPDRKPGGIAAIGLQHRPGMRKGVV